MEEFKYKDKTHKIIGAAMAVHRFWGCGFTEKVYQDALEIELQQENIPYKREQPLSVEYSGVKLKSEFMPDFICYDDIIVELKAAKEIEDIHRSQALNYAKVSGCEIALLINFGQVSLQFERFIVGRKN
ncbi:MAG: GxxExxY protein [Prevotella sp.]|nr:GxxExxY protein [Prevotella sp.]